MIVVGLRAILGVMCFAVLAANGHAAAVPPHIFLPPTAAAETLQIKYLLIDTSPSLKRARARAIVANPHGERGPAVFSVAINGPLAREDADGKPIQHGEAKIEVELSGEAEQTFALEVEVEGDVVSLWTPQSPDLYSMQAQLTSAKGDVLAAKESNFGWRTIRIADKRIYVNDQPIYLRGSMRLPIAYSPTHYIPAHMRRVIESHKAMNFNFIRHHTTVPPAWFYPLADEMGIYNSIEMGFDVERSRDIVHQLYNHPSIIMWGGANELAYLDKNADVQAWYQAIKAIEPARPVYDSTGWGEYDRDSTDVSWDHYGVMLPYAVRDGRNLSYFDQSGMMYPIKGRNLYDAYNQFMNTRRISGRIPAHEVRAKIDAGEVLIDKPQMMHEIHGASQTYTEGMLEHEHILRGFYEGTGRDYSDWPELVRANLLFSAVSFKTCLEYARAADRQNGFDWIQTEDCVVDVNYNYRVTMNKCGPMDLAGVTDHFGKPKPFVEEAFRVGNAPHVLLLNQGEQTRTLWNDDTLRGRIQSSCFDFAPPAALMLTVKLMDGERVLETKAAKVTPKFPGVGDLMAFELPLGKVKEAKQLTLRAELGDGEYKIANEWNVWVFPRIKDGLNTQRAVNTSLEWVARLKLWPRMANEPDPDAGHVLITDELSTDTLAFAERGGRVVVLQSHAKSGPPTVKTNYRQRDYTGYYSGYNMGVVVKGLEGFPHRGFNDLQFHSLLEYSNILVMDHLPRAFTPILGCVPVLEANRPARSGFLYEAGVGKGAVLISGMNLMGAAEDEPAAKAMLCALIEYAAREDYAPRGTTTADEVLTGLAAGRDSIWPSDSNVEEEDYDTSSPLYAYPDFAQTDDWGTHGMIKALDGYRTTYWQARDLPGVLALPVAARNGAIDPQALGKPVTGMRVEFLDKWSLPAEDGWKLEAKLDAAKSDTDSEWQAIEADCVKESEVVWVLKFAPTQAERLRLNFTKMNALNEAAVAAGAYPEGVRAGYPVPAQTYKETARVRIREVNINP